MSLSEFLHYAGTLPGINAIIGVILSIVVDYWPAYDKLDPKLKRLIMMLLCFTVPLLSLCGLVLTGNAMFTVDSIWQALSAGFTAFWSSQATHAITDL